VSITKRALFW